MRPLAACRFFAANKILPILLKLCCRIVAAKTYPLTFQTCKSGDCSWGNHKPYQHLHGHRIII